VTEPDRPRPAHPLIDLGLGAAWLVGSAAALQILDGVLGRAALGTALAGAILVDFAAGRAGVRWEVDDAGPDAWKRAAQRVAAGAGVALALAAALLGAAVGLGWIDGRGAGMHPSSALGFALARAAAIGVRDELLYRGIPLAAAARAGVPAPIARGFAALSGGAALALVPGVSPAAVALAVGSGWLFAALWERDRAPWAAVGAHATWALVLGSVLHGGLFDADWVKGNLSIDASAAGAPAWVAAIVLGAAGFGVRMLPGGWFGASGKVPEKP
jgi:hypothetical protein